MTTALITGSSRGIGLEFCRQLRERGTSVIATCRAATPELEALDVRVEAGVDVTSDASIAGLAAALRDIRIDLLILNAGVLQRNAIDDLDLASVRRQFEVNSLGPLRVIKALLVNLRAGSKIALITSKMGSIADNTSGGHYGYRMSKAALNMAGASLAVDLRPRGIAVGILHPGYVRTRMTGMRGVLDPDASVEGMLARIDRLTLSESGGFWHSSGEPIPW